MRRENNNKIWNSFMDESTLNISLLWNEWRGGKPTLYQKLICFLWNVSIHLYKMLSLSHIYFKISKKQTNKKTLDTHNSNDMIVENGNPCQVLMRRFCWVHTTTTMSHLTDWEILRIMSTYPLIRFLYSLNSVVEAWTEQTSTVKHLVQEN